MGPKERDLQAGRAAHQSRSALEPFYKDDGGVRYGDVHLRLQRKPAVVGARVPWNRNLGGLTQHRGSSADTRSLQDVAELENTPICESGYGKGSQARDRHLCKGPGPPGRKESPDRILEELLQVLGHQ